MCDQTTISHKRMPNAVTLSWFWLRNWKLDGPLVASSVASIGLRFYPQNELKIWFYQFHQLGCCLNRATASDLPTKNIKSGYLRVFLDVQSSNDIKYPQFDHKYQVFAVLVITLGQICDGKTLSFKRTPNAVTLNCTRQDNVYGHFRPSFMLSSISPLKQA